MEYNKSRFWIENLTSTGNLSHLEGESLLTTNDILIANYMAAYGLPISIILQETEAVITFYVFYSLRSGLGQSTKLLFIALTSFDILASILWYGLNIFGDYGIGLLTTNAFKSIPTFNIVVCKSFRGTGFFSLYCLNWIYVVMNIERLLAIVKPHR